MLKEMLTGMPGYSVIQRWLTPNRYSRPQRPIIKIKGIVIHWVAVPNGRAEGVYNFFENRKYGKNDFGSAHEVIDLDGSIIQMIPPNEMAYAVGAYKYTQKALNELSSYPNDCTYSIECCHVDWDGTMTATTYNTLVTRCVDLCTQWGLDPLRNLWLHYEITGKDCHRWFVNHPDEWAKFKQLVADHKNNKVEEMVTVAIEEWQKEIGIKAVQELASNENRLISNPEEWIARIAENTPNWLFFEMLRRLNAKINKIK
ncbi:peptidoglycan recognition protein family protein [Moorella sp. E308F]|uniref:peptidoglycan recognition protein family protein n=1 Tax=Moorella sp. E308F TaxID=2572682 RepID=UPI001141ED43|nr:peptidoglycan recognition family protein [Moorella sp. E308F]